MSPAHLVLIRLAVIACLVAAQPCPAGEALPHPAAPVRIILDTDMDSDCDDVGAMAMLHAFADRGECEILALGVSAKHPWSAPCVDALNTFFGRPDLPIGAPKGHASETGSKFARKVAEAFPHDLASTAAAEDAALLYRRVLAAQPERSVVLVTIGDLTNVADLLRLPAGDGLPSGLEVARARVAMWVCMGGNFIGQPARDDLKLGNNNFTIEKAGSLHAITTWPGRLVFVGREIGSVPSGLKAGARLATLPEDNPVRIGYQHYFGGTVKDRHVADQTALLYAVRGLGDRWDAETKGWMDLQPDMTFTWRYDQDRQHAYLRKRLVDGRPNDRAIEQEIEALMMHQPGVAAAP